MGTTIISAKLAKRIIAKISELVGSSIEEKVKGHIETKRTELFIKNYQKKLEEELLEDYVLSSKLNTASSVTLKQVFYSA